MKHLLSLACCALLFISLTSVQAQVDSLWTIRLETPSGKFMFSDGPSMTPAAVDTAIELTLYAPNPDPDIRTTDIVFDLTLHDAGQKTGKVYWLEIHDTLRAPAYLTDPAVQTWLSPLVDLTQLEAYILYQQADALVPVPPLKGRIEIHPSGRFIAIYDDGTRGKDLLLQDAFLGLDLFTYVWDNGYSLVYTEGKVSLLGARDSIRALNKHMYYWNLDRMRQDISPYNPYWYTLSIPPVHRDYALFTWSPIQWYVFGDMIEGIEVGMVRRDLPWGSIFRGEYTAADFAQAPFAGIRTEDAQIQVEINGLQVIIETRANNGAAVSVDFEEFIGVTKDLRMIPRHCPDTETCAVMNQILADFCQRGQ